MSYINPKTYVPSNSTESQLLKLTFLVSVPICFILIVVLVLYIIRRNSNTNVDWSSFLMHRNNYLSMAELGLSKDIREMLPIVIYKESFTVKDSHFILIPKPTLDGSHQSQETIENSNGGGASALPESHSTTEAISHIEEGQEGNGDSQDVSKRMTETA
ncbi:unnamed protein product [Arabidopsis halleri]